MTDNICLTVEQLRSLIGQQSTNYTFEDGTQTSQPDQRYVIVRGDRSRVFCGVIVSEEGRTVELTDCRHVWYWAGAANTAEMALTGVQRPKECKIIAPVARLRVLDAIEVIDCTSVAESSLRAVPVWSKS